MSDNNSLIKFKCECNIYFDDLLSVVTHNYLEHLKYNEKSSIKIILENKEKIIKVTSNT